MRITKIETAEQRDAVTRAATAAALIVERLDGAEIAEFSAIDNEASGLHSYRLLNVWGGGEDRGTDYCTRPHLWCNDGKAGPDHGLTADDVLRIETLVRGAGEMDPNVFAAGELAGGVWDLDLLALAKHDEDAATARLVKVIADRGIDEIDIDELVEEAAAPPNGEAAEVPDEVSNGGPAEQARYLIQKLGQSEAFAAIGLLGRSA